MATATHIDAPTRVNPDKVRRPGSWREDVAAIVELLPDAIFRCEKHDDGRIVWLLNEGKLAEALGITTENVRGRTIDEVFTADVAAQLRPELDAAFLGNPRAFVCEVGDRALHFAPQPVVEVDGKVSAVIGFISDVTDLRRAEAQVRELNAALRDRVAELDAANRQLDTFNCSVSHDLRNPLNSISLSVQQLERHAVQMDATCRAALGRVRRGIKRMDQLIDDVMWLARATISELKREPVDLSQIARIVAEERLLCEPTRNVMMTIPDGIFAHGDARLLRVVLDNLFGNAIKYTQHCAAARIELAESNLNGERVFVVRDNGVGFDMKDADRMFRPFERLHPAADFEGTGVGLATVRRVIDAHGGRIWAESRPGHGASFYFTLEKEHSWPTAQS